MWAPESLALEITESLFIDTGDATLATLRELASLGVRLHLDDFGTWLLLAQLSAPLPHLRGQDRSRLHQPAPYAPECEEIAPSAFQLAEAARHGHDRRGRQSPGWTGRPAARDGVRAAYRGTRARGLVLRRPRADAARWRGSAAWQGTSTELRPRAAVPSKGTSNLRWAPNARPRRGEPKTRSRSSERSCRSSC